MRFFHENASFDFQRIVIQLYIKFYSCLLKTDNSIAFWEGSCWETKKEFIILQLNYRHNVLMRNFGGKSFELFFSKIDIPKKIILVVSLKINPIGSIQSKYPIENLKQPTSKGLDSFMQNKKFKDYKE